MMMPQNIFAQRSTPQPPNYPIQPVSGISPFHPVGGGPIRPIAPTPMSWGGQPPISEPYPAQPVGAQPPMPLPGQPPIAPPQPVGNPIFTDPRLGMPINGQPQPGQAPPNLQNILAMRSMRMMPNLSF